MLVEMRFKNFFSIKEEVSIDFRAASIKTTRAKELNSNVFTANKNTFLKVQGLFGPNASGKSNLIKAIRSCIGMVLNSHSYNEGEQFHFSPFKFGGYNNEPSSFFIDFIIDNTEYEYSFSVDQSKVYSESLFCYHGRRKTMIFKRDETKGPDKKKVYTFNNEYIVMPYDVAQSTSQNTLYLSRASQMDREIAKSIYRFFRTKFVIGLPRLSGNIAYDLYEENKELILQVLKMADSDIVDIIAKREKAPLFTISQQIIKNGIPLQANPITQLGDVVNFYTIHKVDSNVSFNLTAEESAGTIQMFKLFLILLDVCKNDKVLIVDEFDASLHTELAEFVIDVVNASSGAQMLFTSHNTGLINIKKLRRDQILFTKKKDDGSTEVYSLFDFKDFRENMDAEKCYLQGRFDAVPYINSSLEAIKGLLGE